MRKITLLLLSTVLLVTVSASAHDNNKVIVIPLKGQNPSGDADLKSINILRGKTISGVSGTQGLPWGCRTVDDNGNYDWNYTDCTSDCVTDIALSDLCNPFCSSIENMAATLMGIPQLYCDGIGDNYPYR